MSNKNNTQNPTPETKKAPETKKTAEQLAAEQRDIIKKATPKLLKTKDVSEGPGPKDKLRTVIFRYKKHRIARVALKRDKTSVTIITNTGRTAVALTALDAELLKLLKALQEAEKPAKAENK